MRVSKLGAWRWLGLHSDDDRPTHARRAANRFTQNHSSLFLWAARKARGAWIDDGHSTVIDSERGRWTHQPAYLLGSDRKTNESGLDPRFCSLFFSIW